ncbi:MAG: hypothetical protein KKI06_10140 [Euryarchaeota archaeon]|nr:hypothetical protein [Euryarchaeota archaeon]MBU4222986.1 hypothetical protein [Euryarchaeota archaeon]MCG2736147.1 hypothetical protein [Candidatus Methanoperedenaceae archaeon]
MFDIKVIIEGDYLIFVIGNLLADLGMAIFAITTVYSQKQTGKMLSYLENMKSQGNINTMEFQTIRIGFNVMNWQLIENVFEINDLEQDKMYLRKIFKKDKQLMEYQKMVYFLLPVGVCIQIIALIIPII